MIGQRLRARFAARGDAHVLHAQPLREGFQVRAALRPGAHDEQRAIGVGREALRGQQRHGGRAPRSHGGSVEHQHPLAGRRIEHDHVALDGGARRAGIGGREGDQLGDGDARIQRRHHEQAAAAGQRLHQPGRHLHGGVGQQAADFLREGGIGQAVSGGCGVEDDIHWRFFREQVGRAILSYNITRQTAGYG